ncbi:hypothetical protein [Sterolibacterium denitrificans]|uniref:hypothetical protein n=1 Tax=Sterolibacterium denitrificans TaxID=157592 RepID=UPI0012B6858A|nr:hypothetical protein [Sterolibacterium denitrificans]
MSAVIDLETCRVIREVLVIGLSSFGEIERLRNAYSLHAHMGEAIPDDLEPLHPTGAADTVGRFADALAAVEGIESTLRAAAHAVAATRGAEK